MSAGVGAAGKGVAGGGSEAAAVEPDVPPPPPPQAVRKSALAALSAFTQAARRDRYFFTFTSYLYAHTRLMSLRCVGLPFDRLGLSLS